MRRAYYKSLQRGNLAFFSYLFYHHDSNPLVLVTDVMPDRIRGVNLHFLTFKFVKAILSNYCGKTFSYANIKHNNYTQASFRTYKKPGMRNLQILDCEYINNLLKPQRRGYKYNPQELKALKDQIQLQLQKAANPRAEELAGRYINTINNPQGFQQPFQQDARFAFRPAQQGT